MGRKSNDDARADGETAVPPSRRIVRRPSWTIAVVVSGFVVVATWTLWWSPPLPRRVLRDALLYGGLAFGLVAAYDRDFAADLGLRVDREVLRATVAVTLFVLPFYVVGASLPRMRAAYPIWETSAALPAFLPHALGIATIVVLLEVYFRGLLCVGLRHLGQASVVVHLPVYVFVHLRNPPVEIAMSGLAGLFFGAVAYQTRSVLPTATAHALGWIALDYLVQRPPLVPWIGDVLPF